MKIISVFANEDKKRVIHNFFSLTALQIASYVFPIITLPYLVRVLGPEKYGLIAFAQAFTGYFQILTDYGFNLSVTKQIAIERENKDKLNKIFSSVMLIKLTLFLISCLLMTIIVFSVNRFAREFKVYFYTMGMVLSQTLFPIWFFQGVEKMKYITLINVLSRLIFTTLVFVLVKSEVDYLIVPILNSLGMLICAFISLYIIYTKFQIQFVIPKYADVIFQLKDGWHIFISTVAISLYT
ncbi:MAG: oligosaccharide flippase family protein, partial [Acidobacterium ailaaui]|nr:oligosaccharide flippase family protein [Pseudacidobacterium ailaaui]